MQRLVVARAWGEGPLLLGTEFLSGTVEVFRTYIELMAWQL